MFLYLTPGMSEQVKQGGSAKVPTIKKFMRVVVIIEANELLYFVKDV